MYVEDLMWWSPSGETSFKMIVFKRVCGSLRFEETHQTVILLWISKLSGLHRWIHPSKKAIIAKKISTKSNFPLQQLFSHKIS